MPLGCAPWTRPCWPSSSAPCWPGVGRVLRPGPDRADPRGRAGARRPRTDARTEPSPSRCPRATPPSTWPTARSRRSPSPTSRVCPVSAWKSAVAGRGRRRGRRPRRRLDLGAGAVGAAGPGLVALAVVDWRTRLLPTCRDPPDVRRAGRPRARRLGRHRRHRTPSSAPPSAGSSPAASSPSSGSSTHAGSASGTSGWPESSGIALGWLGWGAAARRHLRRLPPRRRPRRAAGPAQDRGPQGRPVRAVHAAGRAVGLLWGEPLWSSLVSG